MGRVISGAVVLLIIAVPALGTSVMRYTVELGGDNHAAAVHAGTRVPYTPGSSSGGAVYNVGDVVTWDAVIDVSGTGPGDYGVQGAANVVYDLALHQGGVAGPLATTATFFSSMNDGNDGWPLHAAGFALSYNVFGNGPGCLPDKVAAGGPNLGVHSYPASLPGRLVGMGAGYEPWDRNPGSPEWMTPGVGQATLPSGTPGLGVVPITEGQIDTSLLGPGVYTLLLNAGQGNNVLRGDVDLLSPWDGPYALAADQVFGDVISFTLVPEPATLALLAAASILLRRKPRR